MEKTIVYVDGFNFYYGVTHHWWAKSRDRAGLGWCDFRALIERHFPLGETELEVKYFPAQLHFENETPGQRRDEQKRYPVWTRALRTIPGIQVVEGFPKGKARPVTDVEISTPDAPAKVREEKQSDSNLAVEVMLDALGPCPPAKVYLLSDDRDLMPVVFALHERLPKPIEVVVLLPSRADARNWQESYRANARKLLQLNPARDSHSPEPTVELLTEETLATSLLCYKLQDAHGEFACPAEWRLNPQYLDRLCLVPEWRPD